MEMNAFLGSVSLLAELIFVAVSEDISFGCLKVSLNVKAACSSSLHWFLPHANPIVGHPGQVLIFFSNS